MSYSIYSTQATKAEAVADIHAQLDRVVESQPEHAADIPSVKVAAAGFINGLADPRAESAEVSGERVHVEIYGSVSWCLINGRQPTTKEKFMYETKGTDRAYTGSNSLAAQGSAAVERLPQGGGGTGVA